MVPGNPEVCREENLLLERKKRCCAARRGQAQPILWPRTDTQVISAPDEEYYPSPCARQHCSNRDNTDLRFPLSTPGPLFLAFLEEYGWDVDILAEPLSSGDQAIENDHQPSEQNRINERYRRKPAIMWRISTYTIRPFLQKLDAVILNECGCGTNSTGNPPSPPTPAFKISSELAQRIIGKSGLRRMCPFMGKEKKEVKHRLFGELAPEPEKSKLITGSKSGLGKETMSAVLLWTIVSGRVEGLASSSPIAHTTDAPLLGQRNVKTRPVFSSCWAFGLINIEQEQKTMNLMKGIKDKTKGIGKRVRLGLVLSSSKALSFVRRVCFGKQRGFAMLK